MTDRFTLIGWDYVNPEFSRFETEKVDGAQISKQQSSHNSLQGLRITARAYSKEPTRKMTTKNNIPSTYNLNFRNFAVGIPGTGGSGTDDVPGLTPGIVQ